MVPQRLAQRINPFQDSRHAVRQPSPRPHILRERDVALYKPFISSQHPLAERTKVTFSSQEVAYSRPGISSHTSMALHSHKNPPDRRYYHGRDHFETHGHIANAPLLWPWRNGLGESHDRSFARILWYQARAVSSTVELSRISLRSVQ